MSFFFFNQIKMIITDHRFDQCVRINQLVVTAMNRIPFFFLFDIMSTIPALDGAVIIKKTDETVIIYLLCSLLFFVSDY